MTTMPEPDARATRELVAFHVAEQDYCVDIMQVREIRGWKAATSLPHAPDYVRGVINLRGSVVPIVDLAARLGLGPIAASDRNVVIITLVNDQVVGLLVEAVFDIFTIDATAIQPTPDVASDRVKGFISGIITQDERMLRLVELERVLPSRDAEVA